MSDVQSSNGLPLLTKTLTGVSHLTREILISFVVRTNLRQDCDHRPAGNRVSWAVAIVEYSQVVAACLRNSTDEVMTVTRFTVFAILVRA